MVQQHLEAMCNLFMTSVILQTECFVTLSSTAPQWSIMEHALEIQVSSNISLLIFNSLENYATLTAPSMSVVSGTENAWQDVAMGIWLERHAWAVLTVTLTCTVMFNSQKLANTLCNLESFAIHQTCATWEADADLTLVKQLAGNAWSISHCQLDLVSEKNC